MDRCAKIVATIGPASQDEATLERLLQVGVDVARLNFSHGSHSDHAEVIARLRSLANRRGKPVCILQDLQGPKIRTGEIVGSVTLATGQSLTLTTRHVTGDSHLISVDFLNLPRTVQPGGRILLDDGNLELVVIAVGEETVETRVVEGGVLKPHKGVNLPGAKLGISSLTEKDKVDLAFGLEQEVDVVALSFVRTADDIILLRQTIAQLRPDCTDIPIIAKLERPEALDNLEAILTVTDGVMVARGDLGVEMPPEAVPIAQKRIIECANRHNKLVITATQMLDSMIHNPRPTRAEASDVANAILDGTDAVMLSGETAAGDFPIQAVQMMSSIVCQAEANMSDWGHWKGSIASESDQEDAIFVCLAARELAHDRNVAAIAAFTKSGRTALLMSKTRPCVPILAFTPVEATYRRLGMYWGVTPFLVRPSTSIEDMLADVETAMMTTAAIKPGQQVVVTAGFPVDLPMPTNMALLHTVGK
jgi:pyruvate kinase